MKSISLHCIIFILFLTIGYHPSVSAVTDADLEALEKQIEQQEQEKKKQAEAEAQKKKAAAGRKREEDLKRIEESQAKRRAEEARLAEEERRRQEEAADKAAEADARRKAEEARLAEEDAKKREEEAKKAEEEKRKQFSQAMRVADSAMNSKNFKDALELYTQALEIIPDDPEALAGQTKAREYQKVCSAIVGEWDWVFGVFVIINADHSLVARALISNTGTWECTDPEKRLFTLHWVLGGWVDTLTLSEDNNILDGTSNIGIGVKGWRKGTKKRDPTKEVPL